MPSVWEDVYVPVRREIMFIIDFFSGEAPTGKSPQTKDCFWSLVRVFPLVEIPKIKICHMVTKEHPELIEGRQRLVSVDVIDSKEVAEDGSINNYGPTSDEEDGSGLVGAVVTEEV